MISKIWKTPPASLFVEGDDISTPTSTYYKQSDITAFLNSVCKLGVIEDGFEVSARYTTYYYNLADFNKLTSIDLALRKLESAIHSKVSRVSIPPHSNFAFSVNNPSVEPVGLTYALSKDNYPHLYTAFLGVGEGYKPITIDLTKSPHILIAGTSGSGKSVALNTILTTLLFTNNPDRLKFIFIDPKSVELAPYKDLPHNAYPHKIIDEVETAKIALDYVIKQMNQTYEEMTINGIKSIDDIELEKQHRLIIVIDELADLVLANRDIQDLLVRISQKGRAAGIHLVICTQRPTVKILSGLIKANITTRIALKTASYQDSINILDHRGAEKLLGEGDALVKLPYQVEEERTQVALMPDWVIEKTIKFWKDQAQPSYFLNNPIPKIE